MPVPTIELTTMPITWVELKPRRRLESCGVALMCSDVERTKRYSARSLTKTTSAPSAPCLVRQRLAGIPLDPLFVCHGDKSWWSLFGYQFRLYALKSLASNLRASVLREGRVSCPLCRKLQDRVDRPVMAGKRPCTTACARLAETGRDRKYKLPASGDRYPEKRTLSQWCSSHAETDSARNRINGIAVRYRSITVSMKSLEETCPFASGEAMMKSLRLRSSASRRSSCS